MFSQLWVFVHKYMLNYKCLYDVDAQQSNRALKFVLKLLLELKKMKLLGMHYIESAGVKESFIK